LAQLSLLLEVGAVRLLSKHLRALAGLEAAVRGK
jgi:hypothetical protein